MGKILILSVTDHEEHILNKIMETIANEPARFMRPYGIETVNAAALPLPVSSVRSGAS